ncbi:MAG: hypothetical protein ACP5NV_04525 [Candidatus Woesearchaeota archaeon]
MNDYFREKYFDMYDENKTELEEKEEFKPQIDDVPKIKIDSRRYNTSQTSKNVSQNNGGINSNNNTAGASPSLKKPQGLPGNNKTTQTVPRINGKRIGDFLSDILYYNPKNPFDLGNYADGIAIGTCLSEKLGDTLMEKAGIIAGTTYGITKIKKYLHENFTEK